MGEGQSSGGLALGEGSSFSGPMPPGVWSLQPAGADCSISRLGVGEEGDPYFICKYLPVKAGLKAKIQLGFA